MKIQKIYKSLNATSINIHPGNLRGLPDDCFSLNNINLYNEKTIVLIDAGFLSKLNLYFGDGKYIKYDLIKFSQNLSKKQGLVCEHIYYYTAPPFQGNNPTKEEKNRLSRYENFRNKLSKESIITIREGRCQRLKIDGKIIYGQKGVDALIIIDLMSIPLEHKKIKKIILIANDSDFVPAVNKLKHLSIEVILYTYYSKNRGSSFSRSNELLKTVFRYIELTKEDFSESSFKDEDINEN